VRDEAVALFERAASGLALLSAVRDAGRLQTPRRRGCCCCASAPTPR